MLAICMLHLDLVVGVRILLLQALLSSSAAGQLVPQLNIV